MTRTAQSLIRPDGTIDITAAMALGRRERAAAARMAPRAIRAALRGLSRAAGRAVGAMGAPDGQDRFLPRAPR